MGHLADNDKKKIIYSMSSLSDKSISNLYLIAIENDDLTTELLNNINYKKMLLNQKISKEAFKNSLYKIRKIEYINNIIKKQLDEDDID